MILPVLASMSTKIERRTGVVLTALKETTIDSVWTDSSGEHRASRTFISKGSPIDKEVREAIAVKLKKAESTVRCFFRELVRAGYASADDMKPVTFTLRYDLDYIEKEMRTELLDLQNIKELMLKMREEAQEWFRTSLLDFAPMDRAFNLFSSKINEHLSKTSKTENNVPSVESKTNNVNLDTIEAYFDKTTPNDC
jgi:hypothetical protein